MPRISRSPLRYLIDPSPVSTLITAIDYEITVAKARLSALRNVRKMLVVKQRTEQARKGT